MRHWFGSGVRSPILSLRARLALWMGFILVAGVAPLPAAMDKCCPSWMSQGIIDRNTVVDAWGDVSRPLFLDCGFRPNHQPIAIPDRLIGRLPPTLALRTRMGGARRFLARIQPGQHSKSLP